MSISFVFDQPDPHGARRVCLNPKDQGKVPAMPRAAGRRRHQPGSGSGLGET
ncbi:hypothetical protein AZA_63962 [Nitrospirillum viridazoti Y2]|nr:hypothetical protein AZA_63962 [Nitrospirillum amazonense Y2]